MKIHVKIHNLIFRNLIVPLGVKFKIILQKALLFLIKLMAGKF